MPNIRFILTRHAIIRTLERDISEMDIADALTYGRLVEDYPNDMPYPSRLLYHCCKDRHLHIVAAYDKVNGLEIIVTVYEPSTEEWEIGFMQRKKQ